MVKVNSVLWVMVISVDALPANLHDILDMHALVSAILVIKKENEGENMFGQRIRVD
jgi:hypothetical protein